MKPMHSRSHRIAACSPHSAGWFLLHLNPSPSPCTRCCRHPLNCEPPMDALMASGFITPPSLHYVRNHGAVPKITWSSHRITINGLVDKPITLTMDELVAMPSVTLPITLVCAGNR